METNELEVLDSNNETETTENETELETEAVDVEALLKENATLKAQKEHWRNKAEKSEAPVTAKEPEAQTGLSTKDTIYIAKADIHEDDIEEVLELAQLKKVSVKEAHDFMRPILKERQEERKTAQATQVRGGTRGTSKDTHEAILAKADKGEDVDAEKLAAARMQRKLKDRK